MKVHKRLCTALPRSLALAPPPPQPSTRARSNSATSTRSFYTAPPSSLSFPFFDSTAAVPPPPSRPGQGNINAISTRLVAEAKLELEGHTPQNGQTQTHSQHTGPPPYSLAFSSGATGLAGSSRAHAGLLHPYATFGAPSGYAVPLDCAESAHPSKRRRTHYHLDVGAYGIPKHAPHAHVAGRAGHPQRPSDDPAASAVPVGEDAYFIRENAMGIADGVGGWNKTRRPVCKGTPSPSALFAQRLMHFCAEEVSAAHHPLPSDEVEFLQEQLDDSLEELADGLDVLNILERAYDKTLHAHVIPNPGPDVSASQAHRPEPPQHNSSAPPVPSSPAINAVPEPASAIPLREGSSTALLAVLEHPIASDPKPTKAPPLFHPQVMPPKPTPSPAAERGAVIRIAHLGDSMAMLVRGDEVIWRTEEMWWTFNTPVQLGPTSPTRPRDAQVFTIPVQEDDILILASDGLSDNLWDEDILDEVVRFRQAFLATPSPLPANGSSNGASTLRRGTLAGMLSEALCSRARGVAERKGSRSARARGGPVGSEVADEIPFARRAREQGKWFDGGKPDDISVLVAVVSA